MKKIGIFGGTFDPIHKIHIEIAKAAMEQYSLEEVFVIPAKIPPNKLEEKITEDVHRYEMVKLACKEVKGLIPMDFELKRDRVSYTSETVSFFEKRYPEAELYLIVGGDSITYMEKWNRPELLFEKTHVLYAERSGDGEEEIKRHIEKVLNVLYDEPKISRVLFRETDVSATRIRKALASGCEEEIRHQLNPKVYEYILEHRLYS